MTRNAQFLWLVAIAVLLRVRAVHPQEKWQSAGMINYEENCDFWGGDFSQYNSKTCGADCVANNYCTHYTSILKCPLAWLWLGNLGCEFQCALKHFSVGSAKPTNVGYVQGQLVSCGYIPSRVSSLQQLQLFCSPIGLKSKFLQYRIWQDGDNGQVQWAPDCDFSGNDIAKQSSDSAEKCRGLCLADGACTHFTWLSNVCTLKRVATGTAKDQDLAGAVCGFVPSRVNSLFKPIPIAVQSPKV